MERCQKLLLRSENLQLLVNNLGLVGLERKVALDKLVGNDVRQPEAVVAPHALKGNVPFAEPLGTYLLALAHLARVLVGREHVALHQLVPVGLELELQVGDLFEGAYIQAGLLFGLSA